VPGQKRYSRERVRLSDVAKKVGVSAITVSRALRNPEKVSPELRQSILQMVDQMGYVPDLAARALASRHNGVIGVLIPALNQPIFTSVMQGIEERVRQTDLRIQYANTFFDPSEEVSSIRAFLAQKPAGLILIAAERYEAIEPLAHDASCPIVHIVDMSQEPSKPAIGIRHRAAAEDATRFLLDKGYRRVALMGGRTDVRGRQRQAGYEHIMCDAGLFDPSLIISEEAATSVNLGCRLFEQLLARSPDVDAVFCQNDDLALGVLFECQRRGIRVPDEVGICGFHDLEFASSIHPGLTTVHVPRYEIGYRAADMLVRAVQDQVMPEGKIDLGFTVVERGTTR
jgi:LacI family transcriptional regulator, gluconate utilization system Gnt-I transcriptional repressor